MQTYEIQDEKGRTLEIQGDAPPTEAELSDIFKAEYPEKQPLIGDTRPTPPDYGKTARELTALPQQGREEMQRPLVNVDLVPQSLRIASRYGVPGAATLEKAADVISKPAASMLSSATSPVGIAMGPAFVGAPELMGPLTTLQTAPSAYEQGKKAWDAIKEGDVVGAAQATGQAGMDAMMAALGPLGLLHTIPKAPNLPPPGMKFRELVPPERRLAGAAPRMPEFQEGPIGPEQRVPMGEARQLPAPATRMPEVSQSTAEEAAGTGTVPAGYLPGPGETLRPSQRETTAEYLSGKKGNTLVMPPELKDPVNLPNAEQQAKAIWDKIIDIEAEVTRQERSPNAIQERGAKTPDVEKAPGDSATVGARVPEPETPAVPQGEREQQPQPQPETLNPVRDVAQPQGIGTLTKQLYEGVPQNINDYMRTASREDVLAKYRIASKLLKEIDEEIKLRQKIGEDPKELFPLRYDVDGFAGTLEHKLMTERPPEQPSPETSAGKEAETTGATPTPEAAGKVEPAASPAKPPVIPRTGGVERPWDIIDEIGSSVGKIRSKKYSKPGSEGYYGSGYDEAKSGPGRTLFGNEGQSPDEALDALRRAGILPENATVDDLWDAINNAAGTRRQIFRGESPQQQQNRFTKALQEQGAKSRGINTVSVGDLGVGDKFKIKGETFEVVSIDPDTGEVQVKDGKKFGSQIIPDGADLPVDKGTFKGKPQKPTFTGEDFALNRPESVQEQKARLAAEEAKRKADEERAKMEEQQAKPLIGSTGDIGQKDMFGGGDMFSQNLGIVPPGARAAYELMDKTVKVAKEWATGLGDLLRSNPNRKTMEQMADGGDTLANTEGRQAFNALRLEGSKLDREAAMAIVEADNAYYKLGQFLNQVRGKDAHATEVIRHAMANYPRLRTLADRVPSILDAQIQMEEAAGINTEYREAYVPHIIDRDLLMGKGRPIILAGRGGSISTGFKKGRTFDTIFDAIEAGYKPKSMDVAELVDHRVRVGQKLINRKQWGDSLRSLIDPTDNKPIVADLIYKDRGPGKPGFETAPEGYVPREILPGVRLAVHEQYARLFDAITGHSAIANTMAGNLLLKAAGGIKHGMLLFDTFHASRILQKEAFLTRSLGGLREAVSDIAGSKYSAKGAGYKKGQTLLEYSDGDLNKAVAAGEISPDMAAYARANRPKADLLMKSGLNVGQVEEALYNSVVRDLPVIGKFNRWVFQKVTRGAMLESGIIEFDRIKAQNPGMTDAAAAEYVSRRLNALYGNLGRQGIFKSGTARDMARIVALAPQWVESMMRTEALGYKELAQGAMKGRPLQGTLGRAMGQGLMAYFVGTQLLNLATRGNFTWDNAEPGHKMDAWIPDLSGKSGGFFISPFSVPAELTHDMLRYTESEGSPLKAAARIASNKMSPLMRSEETLRTGRNYAGQKYPTDGDRIVAAAVNLIPTPLPASSMLRKDAPYGAVQRQLIGSMGVKVEPAPTANQSVSRMARDWMKNSGDPKVQEAYRRSQSEDFATSSYAPLRKALAAGDTQAAREAYAALLKTRTRAQIDRIMTATHPFTGAAKWETKFRDSLDSEGKSLYRKAQEERQLVARRFREIK